MKRPVEPNDIDGLVALLTADSTPMCKKKGEYDTEFVKRIVATYFNAYYRLYGTYPKVKS